MADVSNMWHQLKSSKLALVFTLLKKFNLPPRPLFVFCSVTSRRKQTSIANTAMCGWRITPLSRPITIAEPNTRPMLPRVSQKRHRVQSCWHHFTLLVYLRFLLKIIVLNNTNAYNLLSHLQSLVICGSVVIEKRKRNWPPSGPWQT